MITAKQTVQEVFSTGAPGQATRNSDDPFSSFAVIAICPTEVKAGDSLGEPCNPSRLYQRGIALNQFFRISTQQQPDFLSAQSVKTTKHPFFVGIPIGQATVLPE